jgi:hypothetical protein
MKNRDIQKLVLSGKREVLMAGLREVRGTEPRCLANLVAKVSSGAATTDH